MSESAWRYSVYGEWLVQEANQCTCQGPCEPYWAHQPGCGYEPLIKIVDLVDALVAAGYQVTEPKEQK